LLFLLALRETVHIQTWSVWLTVPLALLLFSFSQFENWLLPFQVSFTATTFGLACVVYALATSSVGLRSFLVAAVGALIASLSNLDGLLVWIVFLPAVLRAGRRWALTWAALAIAVIVPYFVGFENSSTGIRPLAMIGYTLAYLGAPVGFPSLLPSQLAGGVSIALVLVNLWMYRSLRGVIAPLVVWIGLAWFALACAVTTAAGRAAQLGNAQALSSRYQAFAALWWVALVVIGWLTAQRWLNTPSSGSRRFPRLSLGTLLIDGVALGLTCLGLAHTNVTGFHDASMWLDAERYDQQCIVQFRSAADSCLALYYPDPTEVRRKAAILEREHMAIFAGKAGSTTYVEFAVQDHSCDRWRGVRWVKPCNLVSKSVPGHACHSC
ncbi:MAG TPA: hypothetical protein VF221_14770, partial [Chloroflexota bacterium]